MELREWLRGAEKVVVAGIGNPIRMDDFAGEIGRASCRERV